MPTPDDLAYCRHLLKEVIKLMKGWEIGWTPFVPKYPDSDGYDLDGKVTKRLRFATKEEAVAKAKEVLPQDFFGAVLLNEFEMVECEYEQGFYETEYLSQQEEITHEDL